MIRMLLIFVLSMATVKVVRSVVSMALTPPRQDDNLNDPYQPSSAVDLVACPVCGVYTTLPCATCAKANG